MVQRLANLPDYVDPSSGMRLLAVINRLRRYHDFRVDGIDNIPESGPTLLVVHHSFATYDILMLGVSIWEERERAARALADRLIFKIPFLSREARNLGAVAGNPDAAKELLKAGEMVMVAPGGMREALRTSEERHTLAWGNRLGFARLAIETGATIIPAACPAADDIYTVHGNRVTDFLYKHLRVPVPLVNGVGVTPWPRPVALTHYIGAPIVPPKPARGKIARQKQIVALQRQVGEAMLGLLHSEDD
jgi:1-acyl-sn-glycerol-3-phosphate acyltransferase